MYISGLVPRFHRIENQFWAVGCGLGWNVGKRVWADYEQLFWAVFSIFHGQFFFDFFTFSALKSSIKNLKCFLGFSPTF